MNKFVTIKVVTYRLVLILGLLLMAPINAADKQAPKPFKPSTYPYPYPYDEHPCPTGKCSRANENPKHKNKFTEKGDRVDED